jgi:hypothetical protein
LRTTADAMSANYVLELGGVFAAWLSVDFTTDRRGVTDYSVVLVVDDGGRAMTVRVYDGAHGENELHRYTRRGGKQAAEIFHRGTLGVGMRTAIEAIKCGHESMIEAWRTR